MHALIKAAKKSNDEEKRAFEETSSSQNTDNDELALDRLIEKQAKEIEKKQ